jgi:hypothetical protein
MQPRHSFIRPTAAAAAAACLLFAAAALAGTPASAQAGRRTASVVHSSKVIERVVATRRQLAAAAPQVATGDTLGSFEQAMADDFPNTYGGLYVSPDGNLVIPTVGAARSLRAWARANMPAVPSQYLFGDRRLSANASDPPPGPTFTPATVSFDDLVALKADILANSDLVAAGVVGAGIDVENGVVSVTTTGGPVDGELEATYGSEIEVTDAAGTSLEASRTDDTPPFNGGDMLISPSNVLCSLGFGLHDTVTGQTYQLTAGHCGYNTWYNEPRNSTTFPADDLVGTTVPGARYTSGIDAQLIADNSSCISWGASGTRYFISGYADAPEGASIMTEGSVGGQVSGTVVTYDWSGKLGSENLNNIDFTTAVTQSGDSGGPVIYPSIYGPLAAGSVVGIIVNTNGSTDGIVQNIDAELWDFSAFIGDSISPNTSSNGTNC